MVTLVFEIRLSTYNRFISHIYRLSAFK